MMARPISGPDLWGARPSKSGAILEDLNEEGQRTFKIANPGKVRLKNKDPKPLYTDPYCGITAISRHPDFSGGRIMAIAGCSMVVVRSLIHLCITLVLKASLKFQSGSSCVGLYERPDLIGRTPAPIRSAGVCYPSVVSPA